MSKNIEELFKQSLEHHEENYDPSAWDALQSKLDSKQETNKKTKSSNWKTLTLITATIGVAGYFMFSNKSDSKKIELKKPTLKIEIKETPSYRISNEKQDIKKVVKESVNKNIKQINSSSVPQKSVEKTVEFKIEDNKNNQKETKRTLIVTSRPTYCQGEIESFKNENEHTIYLIHESGKHYTLRNEEKKSIELNDVGTYYWSFENTLNTENKLKGFEVINSPKINFITPQEFDISSGLPIVSLTSNQNGNNKWYVNGKPYAQGKDFDLYTFNKGKYEIKLINEINGCKSELTKYFYSEENYNLISANGVEPNHSDPKRNSFLPYALFLRKTEFRMLIISPITGETIFETTDLDKPWKGKNEKTDELVPENSEYIWKVILTNPVKGEKSEYKGRITRI